MAQHDYNIANASGATVRADLNNALSAIVTLNSGATEPATMFAGQWWHDTATALLKRRNAANSAWVTIGPIDSPLLAASETASGISELATNAETATGTDTARVPPVSAIAAAVAYQGLQTIWIPAGAMTPATTNGAAAGTTELATNKNMLKTLDFDTATQEFAQFDITMPKSWNQGTVTFVPRWTAASGSGGVVWALQAVGTRDDDAMDVAFGTEQVSSDTLITANDCHVGPTSSAITVAGTLTSPLRVNFRIKRNVSDGGDTLGVDAKLIGVHVLYSTNLKNDA